MRRRIDPYLLLMFAVLGAATLWPAQDQAAVLLDRLATIAVAGLFFAHGAALSPRAVAQGLGHWRLHLFILAATFVGFPLALVPMSGLVSPLLPADLVLGFLYLAVLPSAVSSSIAFTGMARGNVPAAICSSAASNLFGLMLTPILFVTLTRSSAQVAIDPVTSLKAIALELLLPFALGQASRRLTAGWFARHKVWLNRYDQGVILLVIYGAFSHSVANGLWSQLAPASLGLTLLVCCALLAFVMAALILLSRRLGFKEEDEIAAVFCGSKKSLASGLPLAQIMFAGNPGLGLIVLPIMLYNQVRIIAGAVLARRYAERTTPALATSGAHSDVRRDPTSMNIG